jgi:hypothetical protein
MLEGFNDYRSPFDVNPERHEMPKYYTRNFYDVEDPDNMRRYHDKIVARGWETSHEKWANAREAYATNHQVTDLSNVLRYVTLDNPPPAKDLYRNKEVAETDRELNRIGVILALYVIVSVAVIVLTHVFT